MVSKFFSQTFPTAVNITTAYNHDHKHRYSRSVLFQVDAQYRQDNSPQHRTIFRTKRNLLALGDKRPAFVRFIGSGIGLSLSMSPL